MARRPRPLDDDRDSQHTERWLISYADFITLLFALFVVMYSVSSVNDGKYRVLSSVLQTVFSKHDIERLAAQGAGVLDGGRGVLPSAEVMNALQEALLEETAAPERVALPAEVRSALLTSDDPRPLERFVAGAGDVVLDPGQVRVRRGRGFLSVELDSEVLFDSARAELRPAAAPLLARVAAMLRDTAGPVRVEGHTDARPIHTAQFPSNWELSAARAAGVVRVLERDGIAAGRLAAVGLGASRPVADNATEEGRRRNRRVVIAVGRELTDESVEAPVVVAAAAADGAPPAAVSGFVRVRELPPPDGPLPPLPSAR